MEKAPKGTKNVKRWQQSEVDTLRRMKAKGYCYCEIAEALGRPFQSVVHKWQRLPVEAVEPRRAITLPTIPSPRGAFL